MYNTCICIYICTRLCNESICSGTQSHHMSERNEYKFFQYMCTHTYIYTYIYTYIHTCSYMHVYVCTCVCVYTISGVIRFSAVGQRAIRCEQMTHMHVSNTYIYMCVQNMWCSPFFWTKSHRM